MNFKFLLLISVTILAFEPSFGQDAPNASGPSPTRPVAHEFDAQNFSSQETSPECTMSIDKLQPLQTPEAVAVRARFIHAKDLILNSISGIQINGQSIEAARAQMAAVDENVKVYPRLCEREVVDGIASYRGSAQWWRNTPATGPTSTPQNGIRISLASLAQNEPELVPALSLHEYLGAIGVPDPFYECSTSLFLLSRPDVLQSAMMPIEISKLQAFAQLMCGRTPAQTFAPNVDAVHLAGGGGSSSGTGGGGDERTLETKIIQVFGKLFTLFRMKQIPHFPKRTRGWCFEDLGGALKSIVVSGVQETEPNSYLGAAIAAGERANLEMMIKDDLGPLPSYDYPVCLYFDGKYCQLGGAKP